MQLCAIALGIAYRSVESKVLVRMSDWISLTVLSDQRVSHRGPLILGPWVTSMGLADQHGHDQSLRVDCLRAIFNPEQIKMVLAQTNWSRTKAERVL